MPDIFTETKYDVPQEETSSQTEPVIKEEVLKEELQKKFSSIDNIIKAVIIVLIIMVATLIIAVAAIIVDTIIFHIEDNRWHYNQEIILRDKLNEINKRYEDNEKMLKTNANKK